MTKNVKIVQLALILSLAGGVYSCNGQDQVVIANEIIADHAPQIANPVNVEPGIFQINSLLGELQGKKVGVVANQTSLIRNTHLVDTLVALGVEVSIIFAPEHGFRGDHPDGAHVASGVDDRTGIRIVSLYGKQKKPGKEMMAELDAMIFDIQDVGARFYTYLSTLHYTMEAAAESNVLFYVLDRPNPNGFYVDGPVLETASASFVGMHPVPVVYGMTIGEYAQMIKGEKWIASADLLSLKILPCTHYQRSKPYALAINPSPNLASIEAVLWYPSLCFFEGTTVSVGRGTSNPFTCIGVPGNKGGTFEFTPRAIPGASAHPPHLGKKCRGYDLKGMISTEDPPKQLQLEWLLLMYKESPDQANFFLKTGFFDLLAGTKDLRESVQNGLSVEEIRKTWQPGIEQFKSRRELYLIYPE